MKKFLKKFLLLLSLLFPSFAFAEITYKITTPIPGFTLGSSPDLGSYIAAIFQFSLAAVGLVAFFMIVYHGINYILGAANESKVSDAKDGIRQVVYGVILLFGSVVILDTINPCILKSVNFWSNRDSLSDSCLTSTPQVSKSLDEYWKDNLEKTGVEIVTSNDGKTITITGKKGEDLKRLVINSDSGFSVSYMKNNSWEKSEEGEDIYQYDYTNSFDGDGVKEKIEKEVAYFLANVKYASHEESDTSLAVSSESFKAEYKVINNLEKEENITFSYQAASPYSINNEVVSFIQKTGGLCSLTPSIEKRNNNPGVSPYYHCNVNIIVILKDNSGEKEVKRLENQVLNLENFPENKNDSQLLIQDFSKDKSSELINSYKESLKSS